MKLNLVYATDSGYLVQTLLSACSAVYWSSRRRDLDITVLDCGMTNDEWSWFHDKLRLMGGEDFSLKRMNVDTVAFKHLKSWHNSKGIYARLEIPFYLSDADWCVYADGDTLFINDPFRLEALYDDDVAIFGHLDSPGDDQRIWHEKNGLPWNPADHFCAGFVLMNLKWFRENQGTEKCFELLRQHPDFPMNEQDALNIVCRGKIKLLPDEWGRFAFYQREHGTAGCLHYVCWRPWNMPLNMLLPLLPVHEIWLRCMANVLGVKRWQFDGVGFWKYVACAVKTRLVLFCLKFANVLPGHRGRYDEALRLRWARESIDRLVCGPCSDKVIWRTA